MIKIEIDPGAGFCFGVDEVIRTAENRLRAGDVLYGLGDMVHNAAEMERLKGLGLRTINHDQLSTLSPGKVLFRAHGEPPSTFQIAKDHGLEIIDGTCPIVSRLQDKISKAYTQMDPETDQLVIFGKSGSSGNHWPDGSGEWRCRGGECIRGRSQGHRSEIRRCGCFLKPPWIPNV